MYYRTWIVGISVDFSTLYNLVPLMLEMVQCLVSLQLKGLVLMSSPIHLGLNEELDMKYYLTAFALIAILSNGYAQYVPTSSVPTTQGLTPSGGPSPGAGEGIVGALKNAGRAAVRGISGVGKGGAGLAEGGAGVIEDGAGVVEGGVEVAGEGGGEETIGLVGMAVEGIAGLGEL